MLKKLPENTKKQLNKQRWSALQFSSCSRALVSVCSFNFFFSIALQQEICLFVYFQKTILQFYAILRTFYSDQKDMNFFHIIQVHELVVFITDITNLKKPALCSANLYDENITLFNLKIMFRQKNYIHFVFLFRSVSKRESFRDKYVLLRVNVMLKIIYVDGDMHCFPQGPWNLSQ